MKIKFLTSIAFFAMAVQLPAQATVYTSDNNLANFTNDVTEYATFTSGYVSDFGFPYTPTASTIGAGYRVYGNDNSPALVAEFSKAVSSIRVFANMDHLGAAYDGYQYTISGSNDGTNYTQLFDAITVNGSGEPFTLGSFSGTAPTKVNNVTTGSFGPGGITGYEADFQFGSAYKFYSFGASTVAKNMGNADQELSAVAAVPEPETYAMLLAGLGLMGFVSRRRKTA